MAEQVLWPFTRKDRIIKKIVESADREPFPEISRLAPGEFALDSSWQLFIPPDSGPVIGNAAREFVRFLRDRAGLSIKVRHIKASGNPRGISVSVAPKSVRGLKPEAHLLRLSPSAVEIVGADARGAAQGLYFLINEMSYRRAPVLKSLCVCREPLFERRISRSIFADPLEIPSRVLAAYPEPYLVRFARFGINGVHLYVNLFDFSCSSVIPELASPYARKYFQDLRRFSERADEFGIDVYLHLNTIKIPADSPLWKKHPELKGATEFDASTRVLCSSHPKVLDYYADSISNLFREVPLLKGVFIIVGGECFLHCYTRPVPRTPKGTNCPRCARREADIVVSNLVNRIARAVKSVKKSADVVIWPYSAFLWSSDEYQVNFIKRLSKDVVFLSNFETNEWTVREGIRSITWDYSITQIGPSKRFLAQNRALKKRGIKHYAKTETGFGFEFTNSPYIPCLERWIQRYRRMAASGARGYLACWRFLGFSASIVEELGNLLSWKPTPSDKEILSRLAGTHFGRRASAKAISAWSKFSRAMEFYPFSAFVNGGREIYWKGPFGLGASHPLIFSPQTDYSLSSNFYAICPSDFEFGAHGSANPRFHADLEWAQPYGVEVLLRSLRKVERLWRSGLADYWLALQKADDSLKRKAGEAFAVAKLNHCTLLTAINLAEFYRTRDEFFSRPCRESDFNKVMKRLEEIARNELANAEEALKWIKENVWIGYGFIYRVTYDDSMIEEKIRQVRFLLEEELPRFEGIYRFHIFQKPHLSERARF